MLESAVAATPEGAPRELAREVVADFRNRKQSVPGIGHNLHKPVDPRTVRLFEIAAEEGHAGRYVDLMRAIGEVAETAYGKRLPVNATGAIGALCCELGISWRAARGIAVMGRAVGLVGHLVEEQACPVATEIWLRTEEEAGEHDMPPAGGRQGG